MRRCGALLALLLTRVITEGSHGADCAGGMVYRADDLTATAE